MKTKINNLFNKLNFTKTDIPRFLFLALLFVFILLPVFTMIGNISGDNFSFVFGDQRFHSAVVNSLVYTTIAAAITIILATITAYLLNRASIKHKSIFVLLLTLPMLIPTLSIGLGIRNLFGVNGFIDQIFNIRIEGTGYLGLIIGSILSAFPVAFLLIYDALRYENKSIYDVAETLGVSPFKSFFTITIPYLKVPLISAFFAVFIWIFADYGIPMQVAGKMPTVPVYLYEQVLSQFNYGRGAVVGIVLIIPAIVSFIMDLINKESSSEEKNKQIIKPSKKYNIISLSVVSLIAFILFIPQLSFIILSFVKTFPSDMTFTFNNYINAFTNSSGLGVVQYLINSLIMSLLTGLFGTVIAYVTAYLTSRENSLLGKILHFISLFSLAIPGLVFGVGFVFLFSSTSSFFYGTVAILVAVNIAHFFSSPYIMARNAFFKLNKNYETVGETIGVNKPRIFINVIVPNTLGTIVEMFSYFFINSMITISAVAFLCTYANQPLSILINTFEKQGSYEMQAVVSFIILLVNIIAKLGFSALSNFANKKVNQKEVTYMSLSKWEFDLLTYLERKGPGKYTQRQLADALTISVGQVNKMINYFLDDNAIQISDAKVLSLTDRGYTLIEPYKVRKAIIVAAGFGSRMVPVTLKTPKPLVTVNGIRIIDTLLDALYACDIKNIYIVRGYKAEQFDQLLDKYPTIKFIENPIYNETNNISSLYAAKDYIDRCYICEADLLINNPKIITKYQYSTNYLGAHVNETDDWCFTVKNNIIQKVAIGGENVDQMVGISYWNEEDSIKLARDVDKVFNSRGGKENYWDNVPLKICKKNYKILVRTCKKKDVTEIDNYSELVMLDNSYSKI